MKKSSSPSVSRTPTKGRKPATKRASSPKSKRGVAKSTSPKRAKSVSPRTATSDMQAIRKNGKRVARNFPCECVNKDGTQCSNNAVDGTRFCSRHQNCEGKLKKMSDADSLARRDFDRSPHGLYMRGVDPSRVGRGHMYGDVSLPFAQQQLSPAWRANYINATGGFSVMGDPLSGLLYAPKPRINIETTTKDKPLAEQIQDIQASVKPTVARADVARPAGTEDAAAIFMAAAAR